MIQHVAPRPSPEDKKKLRFINSGEADIHLTSVTFQSALHPLTWNTSALGNRIRDKDVFDLPINGPGEVFLQWRCGSVDRADSFVVQFDPRGRPYDYIFGGDKWTMVLRNAALRAEDDCGDD